MSMKEESISLKDMLIANLIVFVMNALKLTQTQFLVMATLELNTNSTAAVPFKMGGFF